MNIGIDLDGTLADIHTPAIELLNHLYGKHYTIDDIDHWDAVQSLYDIKTSVWLNIMNYCWGAKAGNIKPVELNTKTYVNQLYNFGHKVLIITGRSAVNTGDVFKWLDHNEIKFHSLVFTSSSIPKLSYPIDLLVDDNPTHMDELDQFPNKMVKLFTRPWNKAVVTTHRFDSLSKITDFVYNVEKHDTERKNA